MHAQTHTHTHTHTHCTNTNMLAPTHTHTHPHTYVITCTHMHAHHTHITHTHAHTYTHSFSVCLCISLSPTQKIETLVSSLDVKMLDQILIDGIQTYFTSWFAGASTTVNRCHAWPIRASCIAWHCACCKSGGRSCTVNTRRDSTTAATYCATASSTGMAGLWRSWGWRLRNRLSR